jgi:hypothetical protein
MDDSLIADSLIGMDDSFCCDAADWRVLLIASNMTGAASSFVNLAEKA